MSREPPLFRFRILWIGLCFLAGFLVGPALFRAAPGTFEPLVGVVSVPADALPIGGSERAPPSFRPALLVPAALVLASYAIRAWGTSYLSFRVMRDARVRAERLVVEGPFARVRNPLYVGNVLLAAGLGLLGPPPTMPVVVALVAAVGAGLARIEAQHLASAHPEYAEYRRNVPAFLPRPVPWTAPGGPPSAAPDWRDGFLGEAWHLAIALAITLLATPWAAYAYPTGGAALLAWTAANARRGR